MPESAEVRRLVAEIAPAVGFTVEKPLIKSGRYLRTPIPGFASLKGYTLEAIACKGKLLFFQFKPNNDLSPKFYVMSTLGMTGWWYLSDTRIVIPRGYKPGEVPDSTPKHERLRLEMGDRSLIFTDPRNFGTFKVVSQATLLAKINELGPDIATHDVLPAGFWPRLQRFCKKKTIAEAMLDQRVFCGVGNYMRADALYYADIDPRTPALELSALKMGQLWASAHVVANAAFVNRSVGKADRPFYNLCYGRKTDDFGNPIESYEDSNGRTVWWCPTTQTTWSPAPAA